ncbi:MAG: outer membrane protein assembly factor BamD [Burkholderiales bacterium]|jgi:outer membrane protein assembly factor BamD|nr:outer membrane protein assembly factor BamD [Burkholderiales bacterium]MCE3268244.1 outer membrane protein assembly factor BamD [Burkholderiales bacterium]
MFSYIRLLILAILTLFIMSCSDSDDPVRAETKGWTVQKLYSEANSELANHNYSRSIKLYRVLEATYPYGVYSQQGLLDLAYAYYQDDKSELALPTVDQFISTYPTNINMDYALYLKGYINYKNDNGLMSRFSGQDLSERDPKGVLEAYKAFSTLVATYPNSKFAPDAKDKINRLVNALSRGEIYRSRYYMSIKAYLAAIGRAQSVIINYPNTPYVEEALAIQVVAYHKLGIQKLSVDTLKILAINFPRSKYLTKPWKYKTLPWYAFWQSEK